MITNNDLFDILVDSTKYIELIHQLVTREELSNHVIGRMSGKTRPDMVSICKGVLVSVAQCNCCRCR